MPITGGRKAPFRCVLIVLAMGLLVATGSACNSKNPEPAGNSPRQVTVNGSGQVQGAPDTLTADVGIEFSAPDVTTAMNQTNERQQAVIAAVQNAGVDSKDVRTTEVTLQPQYGGVGGTINGYRANNSVRVTIRKLDTASHVLGVIVGTGGDATRINSVHYSIEDNSQLLKDARARAFQDAKNRAEQYAQLANLRLGHVISISETGAAPPAPTPMPRAPMATDVPLAPGQQTVSFSVTVVWQLT
jgi:uncharacterized protein